MVSFVVALKKLTEAVVKKSERRGVVIPLTDDLKLNLNTLRDVYVRFQSGDYRHTLPEQSRCKSLAEWTAALHAKLIHGPVKAIEFIDSAMVQTKPLSPAMVRKYFQAMARANAEPGGIGERINGHRKF